jgi:mannose-6-phosphate isomerase-like protein (cupin superfamily)
MKVEKIDLSTCTIGLHRDGTVDVVESAGRPRRIDGYVVGLATVGEPRHNGEMHPDADEILFLVSGRVAVSLELEDGEQVIELGPGDTCIVPKGTWHRVLRRESGKLLHITPGPGGEARPLPGRAPGPQLG